MVYSSLLGPGDGRLLLLRVWLALAVVSVFCSSDGFFLDRYTTSTCRRTLSLDEPGCRSFQSSAVSSVQSGSVIGNSTASTNYESNDSSDDDSIAVFPTLYESDRILIIEKPSGIPHHNDNDNNNNNEGTIITTTNDKAPPIVMGMVNRTRQQHPEQRLWGVHRLDRVTSGILVFAKDAEMASHLSRAFAQGDIQKVYFGLSAKRAKKKQGWVQGGMSKSRDKSWKLLPSSKTKKTTSSSSKDNNNKKDKNYAKTRFFTARWCSQYTCILFRPYTGKTHQLRVAAKAMGIALLGDPIYSDGSSGNNDEAGDGIKATPSRTYLHASGIHIPSLDGHESVSVWSRPPFEEALQMKDPDDVVSRLMSKHCDVPSLVDAAGCGKTREEEV